jgi:hypothetical protein
MVRFRWSKNGIDWTMVDASLPYTIPGVTFGDQVLVEPIGAQVSTPAIAAPALLRDLFNGTAGSLVNGRKPNVGPNWSVTGPEYQTCVLDGSGAMYQTGSSGASYAQYAGSPSIGEIGCILRFANTNQQVKLGGPATPGETLYAQVLPSGETVALMGAYTIKAGDTLAQAAAGLAASLTANSAIGAAGITCIADGINVDIVSSDRAPQLTVLTAGGTATTISIGDYGEPVIANYPTGSNFLQGMLHCATGPNGLLLWTFYINGLVQFTTLNRRTIGLAANTDYIYRVCIDPPYVWGGIWQGETLLSAAWAQDARIATYRGGSAFFENGPGQSVHYRETWVLDAPSVPLATIQTALGS